MSHKFCIQKYNIYILESWLSSPRQGRDIGVRFKDTFMNCSANNTHISLGTNVRRRICRKDVTVTLFSHL
jgi:hypothetical protein